MLNPNFGLEVLCPNAKPNLLVVSVFPLNAASEDFASLLSDTAAAAPKPPLDPKAGVVDPKPPPDALAAAPKPPDVAEAPKPPLEPKLLLVGMPLPKGLDLDGESDDPKEAFCADVPAAPKPEKMLPSLVDVAEVVVIGDHCKDCS